VLELVEEALDEVVFAIEREIANYSRELSIGVWWNHRSDLAAGERLDQRIGMVGLVADQGVCVGAIEQRFCASQIVDLAGRDHQVDGIAQRIDKDVNLGGPVRRAIGR